MEKIGTVVGTVDIQEGEMKMNITVRGKGGSTTMEFAHRRALFGRRRSPFYIFYRATKNLNGALMRMTNITTLTRMITTVIPAITTTTAITQTTRVILTLIDTSLVTATVAAHVRNM